MPVQTEPQTQAWDTTVQQPHGGQSWSTIENFVEDFSVTTNALGTPAGALKAAHRALDHTNHYPAANQEPAKSALSQFLWGREAGLQESNLGRLLLGNGASELLDLIIRTAPAGPWKAGPWDVQYKEYERAAIANNRVILPAGTAEKTPVVSIVNPCNPTGDYMDVETLKQWLSDNVADGGVALVDESMQPWLSSEFRKDSLISQGEFLATLFRERGISVYLIHSWTKLWCCAGIRVGSVICPTVEHCQELKRLAVPWSVNCVAIAFVAEVVKDEAYLAETWRVTTPWRKMLVDAMAQIDSTWECHGEEFLSWVWMDVKKEQTAKQIVHLAHEAGVPVRSGGPGYNRPTFVRLAVRAPEHVDVLVKALSPLRAH
ncbi:PLP-dependent transferase [Ramicandelaber brevisporus]|nr:PLP-dependent transferase [Ramicandelaber brevisporus]